MFEHLIGIICKRNANDIYFCSRLFFRSLEFFVKKEKRGCENMLPVTMHYTFHNFFHNKSNFPIYELQILSRYQLQLREKKKYVRAHQKGPCRRIAESTKEDKSNPYADFPSEEKSAGNSRRLQRPAGKSRVYPHAPFTLPPSSLAARHRVKRLLYT